MPMTGANLGSDPRAIFNRYDVKVTGSNNLFILYLVFAAKITTRYRSTRRKANHL